MRRRAGYAGFRQQFGNFACVSFKSAVADRQFLIAKAKEMGALPVKLAATEVFKNLISAGVVSNHTPVSTKARVVKGSGKKSGKIDFHPKSGAFRVVLTGLDATKIDDIEAAVKKILG